MRRYPLFALLIGVCAGSSATAKEVTQERLSRYFSAWYSVCPSTRVTVTPAAEIALPGYEAYRVERSCALKNRNEMSFTLVARQRVVRDIELALRLGLNATPVFFYEGAFLTSESGVAEGYIESRLSAAPAASGRNGGR